MLKILILCKKISSAKSLTNNVVAGIRELRLVGLSTSIEEALTLIDKYKPNIILTTKFQIIDLIKENFKHYFPNIILIYNESEFLPDFKYKKILMLSHTLDFKHISRKIESHILNNYSEPKKEKVKNILTKLGFDFKLKGTTYILESIIFASTYKNDYTFEQLKGEIYPHIAKKHKISEDRVKWAITRSVNYMYQKNPEEYHEFAEKHLKLILPNKPTPKFIINSITNIINI